MFGCQSIMTDSLGGVVVQSSQLNTSQFDCTGKLWHHLSIKCEGVATGLYGPLLWDVSLLLHATWSHEKPNSVRSCICPQHSRLHLETTDSLLYWAGPPPAHLPGKDSLAGTHIVQGNITGCWHTTAWGLQAVLTSDTPLRLTNMHVPNLVTSTLS